MVYLNTIIRFRKFIFLHNARVFYVLISSRGSERTLFYCLLMHITVPSFRAADSHLWGGISQAHHPLEHHFAIQLHWLCFVFLGNTGKRLQLRAESEKRKMILLWEISSAIWYLTCHMVMARPNNKKNMLKWKEIHLEGRNEILSLYRHTFCIQGSSRYFI